MLAPSWAEVEQAWLQEPVDAGPVVPPPVAPALAQVSARALVAEEQVVLLADAPVVLVARAAEEARLVSPQVWERVLVAEAQASQLGDAAVVLLAAPVLPVQRAWARRVEPVVRAVAALVVPAPAEPAWQAQVVERRVVRLRAEPGAGAVSAPRHA